MHAQLILLLTFFVCVALHGDARGIKPTSTSLCGEQVNHTVGFVNGLYYVLYESSLVSERPTKDIPVVLWLSGGPGCSGLVAALFENGPCTFDDVANEIRRNTYAWTNAAHVVYIDQPHGTGFSDDFVDRARMSSWTEGRAMTDLAGFIEAFFDQHPMFDHSDVFIFGESFGGHYAPDVAARLMTTNQKVWQRRLKGVGIGNGVVSPIAGLQTTLAFAQSNKYASDLLGNSHVSLLERQRRAIDLTQLCLDARRASSSTPRHRIRARALDDDEDTVPPICHDAAVASTSFEALALDKVVGAGHNMYDIRRECMSDPLGLCYRFTRLQEYVNEPEVLAYFGVSGQTWSICSSDVITSIRDVDYWEDSKDNVALLLNNGIRVLVYVGDADAMAPWNMQDRWTHDMVWSGASAFTSLKPRPWMVDDSSVGEVTSARGLSLVRVFDAGHMVPHDQPKVALHLLQEFITASKTSILT